MSLALATALGSWASRLDPAAERVQKGVSRVLAASPWLRNVVDGRQFGIPLHPVVTDVPLGAWTAAAALDLMRAGEHQDGFRPADAALAIGVAGAVPAALTGLADYSHLRGDRRRIGSLHAALNASALVLNVLSLVSRARGRRGLGRALSLAAIGPTIVSAHLGGQLSFGLGVRVNRTAWEEVPAKYTTVAENASLDERELLAVDVDGVPVLLARSGDGQLCAISATCSHLGGPLAEGKRIGNTVVCPWHGSRFDLCTGEVLDSPAVFPQPRHEARVWGEHIQVRRRRTNSR
jgi:nitrite reductase/ring-hydroxylating ferredoxin subunit